MLLIHKIFDDSMFFIALVAAWRRGEPSARWPADRRSNIYPFGIVMLFTNFRRAMDGPPMACNLLDTKQPFYFNSQGVMIRKRSMLFLKQMKQIYRDRGKWPDRVSASTINTLEENHE